MAGAQEGDLERGGVGGAVVVLQHVAGAAPRTRTWSTYVSPYSRMPAMAVVCLEKNVVTCGLRKLIKEPKL